MSAVAILVFVFYAYLAIGFLFAIWFVATGVNRLDENMRHSPWQVRLLLIPGSVALWVVLLKKWMNAAKS